MGSNVNKTTKWHILVRVRVVWAIMHENPLTRLTCTWVHKTRGINKNNLGYISPIRSETPPPHGRMCTKFGTAVLRRRNHLWQFFWRSVKGCRFCRGSKIALSHWLSQSPLTQAGATTQPVKTFTSLSPKTDSTIMTLSLTILSIHFSATNIATPSIFSLFPIQYS